MSRGTIIKTQMIQRPRAPGGNSASTGNRLGATGSRFIAQATRVTRRCWGRALRGRRDELKSPLSGRGTSNWKRWPSGSKCSGVVGGSVVVALWEASPVLEFRL